MTWHSSSLDSSIHLFWVCEKPTVKGRNIRITAPTPEEARKILDRKFPEANILFKKTIS
tara:strand:+ start:3756 stop:3932 length:177 start_codon:yes stop_codon:yes gene_type:complete